MRRLSIALLVLGAWCAHSGADVEKGLAAHWSFDEGKGDVLRDSSGQDNHGTIHGGKWVKLQKGHALEFDGVDDYVDCGEGKSLDLRGPMSIEAWVNRDAVQVGEAGVVIKTFNGYGFTFWADVCSFYISAGANRLDVGPWTPDEWHHVVFTFDGKEMKGYLDFFSSAGQKASRKSRYPRISPAARLHIGMLPKKPPYKRDMPFKGLIDDVRIYNRPLSEQEIIAHYWDGAWRRGEPGEMKLTPYFYLDEGEILVRLDLRGVMPLTADARVTVEVGRPGEKASQKTIVKPVPQSAECELTFKVADLPPGEYQIRAVAENDAGVRSEKRIPFRYPRPPVKVASPGERTLALLAPPREPLSYGFKLHEGGGFEMTLKGVAYPVESTFSYPHGGDNRLVASQNPGAAGEKSWKVTVHRIGADEYEVRARGSHYAIDRRIVLRSTHVRVQDTIRNLAPRDVGIMLRNKVNTEGREFDAFYNDGVRRPPGDAESGGRYLFIAREGLGVGMVALDDVLWVQAASGFNRKALSMGTDRFGLAKGASWTLEWAIYPNGSGDYYDFINAVRKEERLNRKVDGSFEFTGKRGVPSRQYVEARSIKYLSVVSLSHIADDPGISVEGIELMTYPKESALLTGVFEKIHKEFPDLKVMLHVAHNLYATNKPEETYPECRVLNGGGNQRVYPTDYTVPGYFSKERLQEGWRWYIFYATLDNSFGRAMLESVDVMMDEMGCDGVYYDGFPGYAGTFTYDRWDGHTVEIDPKTKTIKRKMGSVVLLSQDLLVAVARKIKSKGGVVMVNAGCASRTLAKEDITFFTESAHGRNSNCASLHLAPTPVMFGDPAQCNSDVGAYQDIYAKLDWGCLFYYCCASGLTRKTVTARMFPITVEEIHSGYIKGKERLITSRPGLYGWPGDDQLHVAYRYDARGRPVPHSFLTTVDRAGVRTEVALKENEMAVLEGIPLRIDSRAPVNLVVQQYDDQAVQLVLNGTGNVRLSARDGPFRLEPDAVYAVKAGGKETLVTCRQGALSFDLALAGQTAIRMERGKGP